MQELVKHVFSVSAILIHDTLQQRLHSPILLSMKCCDSVRHSSMIIFCSMSWIRMADIEHVSQTVYNVKPPFLQIVC